MEMRVGGFRAVEREAVLIFLDFSVKQVLGLLLLKLYQKLSCGYAIKMK
jgi:hypothetical protein